MGRLSTSASGQPLSPARDATHPADDQWRCAGVLGGQVRRCDALGAGGTREVPRGVRATPARRRAPTPRAHSQRHAASERQSRPNLLPLLTRRATAGVVHRRGLLCAGHCHGRRPHAQRPRAEDCQARRAPRDGLGVACRLRLARRGDAGHPARHRATGTPLGARVEVRCSPHRLCPPLPQGGRGGLLPIAKPKFTKNSS
jgi:hypothetical protein